MSYGECWLCGKYADLDTHHIFGSALRSKSEKYGLVVNLCRKCHNEPPTGAHFNANTMQIIHEYGQRKAMEENGWSTEEFMKEFYKNYL